MSGPYQGRDLSNCGIGRLRVAINCGVLSVKPKDIIPSTSSFIPKLLQSEKSKSDPCALTNAPYVANAGRQVIGQSTQEGNG